MYLLHIVNLLDEDYRWPLCGENIKNSATIPARVVYRGVEGRRHRHKKQLHDNPSYRASHWPFLS